MNERLAQVQSVADQSMNRRWHRHSDGVIPSHCSMIPSHYGRGLTPQLFDYLLVLDFEATCNAPVQTSPQEIIEFPVLMLNLVTWKIEATFHCFVKPYIHPTLSAFCTELTGITQNQVDSAPSLVDVLAMVEKWLDANCLGLTPGSGKRSFLFCTCGSWDMNALQRECRSKGIPVPRWSRSFCNIKTIYQEVVGAHGKGMAAMLSSLKLRLDGKHHSGIDDSKNIAKIAVELLNRGAVFHETTSVRESHCPWHGPTNDELGKSPVDFFFTVECVG